MALAAVKDSGGRSRRHLVPVEAGASLADRLAAAQAAVTEPRRRVSELQAALDAAVETCDYAAAAELQGQLPAAREALALAEVDLRVITEAQTALNAATDAERRQVAELQQREQAQHDLVAAREAEQQAVNAISSALGTMRGHLSAAQQAYRRALAAEGAVLAARQAEMQAQVQLGEFPAPGPRVFGSNLASQLADTDVLVQALTRWRP